MSIAATFQPIHQPDMFSTPKNSRPNSSMSSTTDSSENESQNIKTPQRDSNANSIRSKHNYHNHNHSRDTSNSPSTVVDKDSKRFLLRRSSSAMRVRELRDVLTKMTSESENNNSEKEAPVTGSQKARLLVASQQCLVSRLQDLKNEMDSMDNEVTRVRNDIVNSRRFFSAMTGISCGPEWSTVRQQPDSAYTSPTSFISRSTDISPYSSDNDYPQYTSNSNNRTSSSLSTSKVLSNSNSNAAFQQLQHFQDQQQGGRAKFSNGQLSRSDSCSSFMSWKSEVEMASLFPEDSKCVSPQLTPRADS